MYWVLFVCLVGVPLMEAVESDITDSFKSSPYSFGYDVVDEYGTRMQRAESSDGSGTVRGSYGFVDANGMARQVVYVADELGYRAAITTNEPGTQSHQPASAVFTSEAQVEELAAPSEVSDKHTLVPQKASFHNAGFSTQPVVRSVPAQVLKRSK